MIGVIPRGLSQYRFIIGVNPFDGYILSDGKEQLRLQSRYIFCRIAVQVPTSKRNETGTERLHFSVMQINRPDYGKRYPFPRTLFMYSLPVTASF